VENRSYKDSRGNKIFWKYNCDFKLQYPALLWEEELDAQKKPESSEV